MSIILYGLYFGLDFLSLLLAINVVTTGRYSRVNMYFFGLLLSSIAWNLTLFFALPIYPFFTDIGLVYFARLAYGFSIIAGFFILLFSYQIFFPLTSITFLGKEIRVPKWVYWLFIGNVAVLSVLSSFTPLLYESIVVEGSIIVKEVFGPIYSWYNVNFLLLNVLAILMLYIKSKQAAGINQKKLKLLMLAYTFVNVVAAIFNIILPALGNTSFYLLGGASYQVFSITILYGVLRYKLLGTRLMFWKVLNILLFVTLIAALVFAAHIGISQIPVIAAYNYIILPVITVILYLLGHGLFLKNFYRGRVFSRFQKTIKSLKTDLKNNVNLIDFSNSLHTMFSQQLSVEKVEIFSIENVLEQLDLAAYPNNELTAYLAEERKEIVLEEWKYREVPLDAMQLKAIVHLTVLNAEVCIPLFHKQALIGMLVIGPRKSSEPYYSDEIDQFKILAEEVSAYLVTISLSQKGQRTKKQLDKTKKLVESSENAKRILSDMNTDTRSAYEVIREIKAKESTMETTLTKPSK